MNEHSSSADKPSDPSVAATAPSSQVPPLRRVKKSSVIHPLWQVLTVVLVVLVVLLAAGWWQSRNDIRDLRQEVAQRLQSNDHVSQETRQLVRSLEDNERTLQRKVNQLESRQAEAQNQQVTLEQLYEELSKNRDDWALTETEQVLSTANQQLELSGNVRGALIALQSADARLARSDHPQSVTIRRAIASDIEKLRLLPNVDLPALATRLDQVVVKVDSLPLLTEAARPIRRTTSKTEAIRADANSRLVVRVHPWLQRLPGPVQQGIVNLENGWHSWTHELWTDLKQVIRVRTVGTPDALLLSPTEEFYARENLKLRLLSARLALWSRNETTFRDDLSAAQETIARYFDLGAPSTRTVLRLLKQMQSSDLTIDMTNLSDSLSAIRSQPGNSQ